MIKRINNSSSVPNFAYEEINIGLIVAILLDPQNAPRVSGDIVVFCFCDGCLFAVLP